MVVYYNNDSLCDVHVPGESKKKKKNAIIKWGLYFKNKRNLEKVISISK